MSSDGYANRLSKYPNKGTCGLPELFDSKRALDGKIRKLVKMMKNANRIVVITGAGISTSAGIPDFRGPNGIWTTEKRGKKELKRKKKQAAKETASYASTEPYLLGDEKDVKCDERDDRVIGWKRRRTDDNAGTIQIQASAQPAVKTQISFESAKPTLTHRAITKLADEGILKYCVTQNVDGLHRRSGLPRSKHSILHGCIFTEKCEKCDTEYFRDYDVGGLSFKKTGRQCTDVDCGGDLRDTILDWEDELPEKDWLISQEEFARSDLCICLGTSLRIEPAGSLPTRARNFVIVNKQSTPYDNKAEFCIRASVDDVLQKICIGLNLHLSDKPNSEVIDPSQSSLNPDVTSAASFESCASI